MLPGRGTNQSYAKDKSNYAGFGYGQSGSNGQYHTNAAEFNIEGNIMSLIYGDNFANQTTFNGGTYNFCSLFKKSKSNNIDSYNPATEIPVLKCSICTGEQVAGFQNISTGHFRDVMLITDLSDLNSFCKTYNIDGDIKKIY